MTSGWLYGLVGPSRNGGMERMQEMSDPALPIERARATWQKHGRSEKWIQQRMKGQETRNKLTAYWSDPDLLKSRRPMSAMKVGIRTCLENMRSMNSLDSSNPRCGGANEAHLVVSTDGYSAAVIFRGNRKNGSAGTIITVPAL